MTIALRSFVIALAAMVSCVSSARADTTDCGDAAEAILQNAYPNAQRKGHQFILDARVTLDLELVGAHPGMVCKIWPAHDDLLLVAIPLIDHTKSNDDENTGDLDVLVVDRKSLQVRQRLLQPGLMTDDAMAIHEVDFDTGPYRLTPDVTAFGISIHIRNNSGPNPSGETTFRLYAISGGELRLVFDGIDTASNGGEWDTRCAGEFESSKSTLAMNKTIRHGYHGITVTERNDSDKPFVNKHGDCKSRPGKRVIHTYRLTYDGARYQLPKTGKPPAP